MSVREAMTDARVQMSVLLVEDDSDFADLVTTMLAENPEVKFDLDHVRSTGVARERLAETHFDAVLLDLGLPDSDGLRTVRMILDQHVPSAVVVLTAVADQHVAQESLELGAQEFIVKSEATSALLVRTLRYAVERQRLLNQLREAREREAQERELRQLERLSNEGSTSVTAAVYGGGPLHLRAPDRAEAAMAEYGRLLDLALEDRAFRGAEDVREDLRSLAQVLGFLGATPRDVVRLHAETLRERIASANYDRAQAYVEEGRVHVLELMGYVASYYRNRAMGSPLPAHDSSRQDDA